MSLHVKGLQQLNQYIPKYTTSMLNNLYSMFSSNLSCLAHLPSNMEFFHYLVIFSNHLHIPQYHHQKVEDSMENNFRKRVLSFSSLFLSFSFSFLSPLRFLSFLFWFHTKLQQKMVMRKR